MTWTACRLAGSIEDADWSGLPGAVTRCRRERGEGRREGHCKCERTVGTFQLGERNTGEGEDARQKERWTIGALWLSRSQVSHTLTPPFAPSLVFFPDAFTHQKRG